MKNFLDNLLKQNPIQCRIGARATNFGERETDGAIGPKSSTSCARARTKSAAAAERTGGGRGLKITIDRDRYVILRT